MLIAGAVSMVPVIAMIVWSFMPDPPRTEAPARTSADMVELAPPPVVKTPPRPVLRPPVPRPVATTPTVATEADEIEGSEDEEEAPDPERHPTVQQCLAHDEVACEQAGQAFRWGRSGFPKSPEKAREYFSRGCDLDHAMACIQLAFMVKNGDGGEADEEEAEKLFTKNATLNQSGCDEGDVVACVRLADAYRHGRGVDKDVDKADEIMKSATPDLEAYKKKLEERRKAAATP